jgi:hypothetical protein
MGQKPNCFAGIFFGRAVNARENDGFTQGTLWLRGASEKLGHREGGPVCRWTCRDGVLHRQTVILTLAFLSFLRRRKEIT